MSLDPARRAQIESYVRPLYVELDGVDTFESVSRRGDLTRSLVGESKIDHDYLELLLLFHGTVKRLGSTDPGGRWWLFLRHLGLSESMLHGVSRGLTRWRDDPRGPEEEALHDAELLEEVGVAACARRVWWAGRKRLAFSRALSTLDPGPDPERFKTVEGRRRAVERREAALAWLDGLREAVATETSG